MAAMMETGVKFNRIIQDDCITTSELCTKIRIGKFVMAILKVLGSEQFAHCVPKAFTIEHKRSHKTYIQNFVSTV